MTLADIRDMLLTITDKVYHFSANGATGNYIVWGEDSQAGASYGDNKMNIQAIGGTVDYFTTTEFDSTADIIQQAMNDADMTWSLESVQYEEDAKYIHYEWTWEVANPVG